MMKTLLVPTDFSDTSVNAVHYAAAMAKAINARLVLLHAYHIPPVSPEVPSIVPTIESLEAAGMEALVHLRAKVHLEHGPHLPVDLVCKCGFAIEEIEEYLKQEPADLVVMGMRGAGYLGETLLGSVTTSLMQRLKVPVLAVNKTAAFTGIGKLTFAYDYKTLESKKAVETLKSFCSLFGSYVFVLKVCRTGEMDQVPEISEAVAGVRMDHLLEGIDHSFHFIEDDQVAEGIGRFSREKKSDLVVMVPHRHSFFEKLFHASQTKHMAFHLDVPLLSLPE